jgi:hypothetical protein
MKKILSCLLATSIFLSSTSSFASVEKKLNLDEASRIELQTSFYNQAVTVENILRDSELSASMDDDTREELELLSQDLLDASENPSVIKKPRKFKKIAVGVVQGVGVGIHTTVLFLFSPLIMTTEFVSGLVIGESKNKAIHTVGEVATGAVALGDIYLLMSLVPGFFPLAVIGGFAMLPGKLVCFNRPETNQKFCGKIAKVDHVLKDQLGASSNNAGVSINKKIKKIRRKIFTGKDQTAESLE